MPKVIITSDPGVEFVLNGQPVSGGTQPVQPTPPPSAPSYPSTGSLAWPPKVGTSSAVDLTGVNTVAQFTVPAGYTGGVYWQVTQIPGTTGVPVQCWVSDSPGGGTISAQYSAGSVTQTLGNTFRPANLPHDATYYIRMFTGGAPAETAHFTILLQP